MYDLYEPNGNKFGGWIVLAVMLILFVFLLL